jgi:hypothetical protein
VNSEGAVKLLILNDDGVVVATVTETLEQYDFTKPMALASIAEDVASARESAGIPREGVWS